MHETVGGETMEIRPIDEGWVSDATFKVSKQIAVHVKVSGTEIARLVVFCVAPLHVVLDELVLG